MSDPLKKKFVPVRMLIGLALLLGAAGFLFAMFFTDLTDGRISIKLTLLCGLLIVGGVVLASGAFATACARCNEELKEGALFVPLEWQQHLAQVVSARDPNALSSLASAPGVTMGAGTVAVLAFEFCPSCASVARMHACTRTWGPDGSWKDSVLSPTVVLAGPKVSELVSSARQRGGVP